MLELVLFLLAIVISACTVGEDVLHFPLPELGSARSMVLLIEDDEDQNPIVVLTDLPFRPLELEGELLSLEEAEVEVALFSCPLAGLGLEAGRGRPGRRDAEGRRVPQPAAVFHRRYAGGVGSDFRAAEPGARATRLDDRALDVEPSRACPSSELRRIPVAASQGNLRLLGAFGEARAAVQFNDGSFGLVDGEGVRYVESPFAPQIVWASAMSPEGTVIVAGPGGRSVWSGTLEDGFVERPPLIAGRGDALSFSAPREPTGRLEVLAMRWDSVQRYDGVAWSSTSSLTFDAAEDSRRPSIVHVGPEEALFIHPDSRGVYRLRGDVLSDEPIAYEEPDKRSASVAFSQWHGGLVGGEDTSVRAQDAEGNWVEISPPRSRGQTRFVLELGRHVLVSDGQGTLHLHDPTFGLECPEIAASNHALGFGIPLGGGVIAVGSEPHRAEAFLGLVSFEDVHEPCDRPID